MPLRDRLPRRDTAIVVGKDMILAFPGEVLKNLTDSSLLIFKNGHAIAQQNGCIKER